MCIPLSRVLVFGPDFQRSRIEMANRSRSGRLLGYYVTVVMFLVFTVLKFRQERYSPGLKDAIIDITGNLWSTKSSLQPQDSTIISAKSLGQIDEKQIPSHMQSNENSLSAKTSPKFADAEVPSQPLSFYEIAIEKGTDKVAMHSYQDMYERYLPAKKNTRIKMLEIGLGCEVGYEPGASYYTWMEYFPHVDLYFIENNPECTEKWQHALEDATIVLGDPGDKHFLTEFLHEHGSDFDFIVSGGGYTMVQQMVSLQTLWKAVIPGGVYFCEYLETSYLETYGGNKGTSTSKETMVHLIHNMIEDLMYPDPNLEAYHLKGMGASWPRKVQFAEVESIRHIDCSRQICAISKRAD